MARAYFEEEQKIINHVASGSKLPVLYFATGNLNKVKTR
jgi:hypothetical protein